MARSAFDTFLIVEAHRTRLLPEFTAAHHERLLNRFERGKPALVGDFENPSFREALARIPPDLAHLVSTAQLALNTDGAESAFAILEPLGEQIRTALVDGWQELRRRKHRHARSRSGDLVSLPGGETYWMPSGLIKAACEAAAADIQRDTNKAIEADWLRRVWRTEFVKLMADLTRD